MGVLVDRFEEHEGDSTTLNAVHCKTEINKVRSEVFISILRVLCWLREETITK